MNKALVLPYLLLFSLIWISSSVKSIGNVPICQVDLVFVLDETREVNILAEDLLQKTADGNGIETIAELRMWHPNMLTERPEVGASTKFILELPNSIRFDCNDIGVQLVELYAIDTTGNWGYCLSNIEIKEGNIPCSSTIEEPSTEQIAGHILTATGTPVKNVALKLTTAETAQASIYTDSVGFFEMKMPANKNFIVRFEREGNITNGVSTFDIVLIAKHIIGDLPFTAPYQYIAADVNRSETVTAFDMVELRRVILGVQVDRFRNNSSWRFISKEDYYAFSNPLGETFTENILLTDLDNPIGDLEFFAIKVGDVNASADLNALRNTELRNTLKVVKINTTDKSVKKGERLELNLTSKDLVDLQSIQFSLFCKGLKVLAIEEGILRETHFAVLGTNKIGVSWDAISAAPIGTKDEILLTLQLEALESGQVNELISLSNEINTEVTNYQNEQLKLALNYQVQNPFELFQNEPNPFNVETNIGFILPEQEYVRIEIFNLQGKLVKERKGIFNKGYNEITINKQSLTNSGTFIYQVQTKQGMLSKKMIVLKE